MSRARTVDSPARAGVRPTLSVLIPFLRDDPSPLLDALDAEAPALDGDIDLVHEGAIDEEEAVKNADSANNVRLKLKLYRDNPATPSPAPVAEKAAATPAAASEKGDWGLELKLEAIEEDSPPEDPGRPGI